MSVVGGQSQTGGEMTLSGMKDWTETQSEIMTIAGVMRDTDRYDECRDRDNPKVRNHLVPFMEILLTWACIHKKKNISTAVGCFP